MAKKVDITEKLSFEGNPCVIVKGEELEVNSDAPTMLKVMGLMTEDPGVNEMLNAYNLLFSEDSRKQIEKMKPNFNDLITIIQEAVGLITDTGDDRTGERRPVLRSV